MKSRRAKVVFILLLVVSGFIAATKFDDNKDRSWSIYKADAASSSYSPLDQINRKTIAQLKMAWMLKMPDALDSTRPSSSECNPIVIDGVMYATSARHRVYAIDGITGKIIWSFDPFNGGRGGGVSRGVTYWQNGNDKRILFTAGDNLFAVNAKTGKLISGFGSGGKVSMNEGFRGDPKKISVIPTSPGIIYKDKLIMGTEVSELYGAEPGYIQCYSAKTGKRLWTFHTIPLPGEPGYDTWPKNAYKYAGGVNAWAGLSVDVKRGMVFLSLGSPTYDFYGADRKGKNLYGNCVLALNAETGKYRWHFQTIHHDLWDYDLPAPPNLLTVVQNGKKIDAVAQVSKVGFVYVLNRDNGKPLFPIEERKVPASTVPGEQAWPTQPFPLKPKPFARQSMTEADLANNSPEAHESLVKKFRSLRYEGLFTPPDLKASLMLPGTRGGAEWGGAAHDPASGVLYVRSNDSPEIDSLVKIEYDGEVSDQSLFDRGKAFYTTYCRACHGADLNGDEPQNPSSIGIKNKMTKEAVLAKIKQGGGKMPAFASVVKGKEEAIVAYLFQMKDRKLSRTENELLEISRNKSAQKKGSFTTTTNRATYLNLTAYGHFRGPDGLSAIKPPWGTLSAIDLNTGDYLWQVPAGNHADLQKQGQPFTGSEGSAGPMATAGGLVFLSGTRDKKLRAFDEKTGAIVWDATLPADGSSTPCSYWANGKQYIALSVAGDKVNAGGYIVAFAVK